MLARDFRAKARASLKGNWALAVLVCLIAGILCGTICTKLNTQLSNRLAEKYPQPTESQIEEQLKTWVEELQGRDHLQIFGLRVTPEQVAIGVMFAMLLLLIGAIVYLLIGGAVSFGYAHFNLNLVDGKPAAFGDLFSRFRVGKGFVMHLKMGLYLFLWGLLLVIPGIVKAYSYAMTPYILSENPSLSVGEAITASRRLMSGNKWRLFCLRFSFIGWYLLVGLTLGIAALFVNPYIEAANAAFFRRICAEQSGESID